MTDLPEDVRQKISSAFAWVDGEIATVKAEIAACECHLALLERIRQGHRVAERHLPDCNRTRLKAGAAGGSMVPEISTGAVSSAG